MIGRCGGAMIEALAAVIARGLEARAADAS